MWCCRRTGKAVWETRRPFSVAAIVSCPGRGAACNAAPQPGPLRGWVPALRRITSCRAASGTRYVKRAAARSIISLRRTCAAAILSFMMARTSGGAVSGEPELNGGAGLYSSRSWIASAVLRSCSSDTSVSAKSMPGGDAAAGDAVAVDADARPGRDRAERRSENPSRSSASSRDSLSADRPRPAPAIPCRPR